MPTAPRSFRAEERKRDQYRGTKQQRGYGGEWERISKTIRQEFPVCQVCNNAPSVDVDHIVPFIGLKDPLRTDKSNLQAICRKCHNLKTMRGN